MALSAEPKLHAQRRLEPQGAGASDAAERALEIAAAHQTLYQLAHRVVSAQAGEVIDKGVRSQVGERRGVAREALEARRREVYNRRQNAARPRSAEHGE